MNQHLRPTAVPLTTQAAEGLPRRRWTWADIEAMNKAGIMHEHERIELIGGEIVPMQSKGYRHELLKNALLIYWAQRLPAPVRFAVETTFHLTEQDDFVEPDLVFFKTSDGLANLRPDTALLAVEISDSSLAYDRGRKARIYASFAVRELWVINAITHETRQFSVPGAEGYTVTHDVAPASVLHMPFAPELDVILASLPLV